MEKFRDLINTPKIKKINEKEIKFEALSVMKEIHSQLAELSFVDVIAVMREENSLRKMLML